MTRFEHSILSCFMLSLITLPAMAKSSGELSATGVKQAGSDLKLAAIACGNRGCRELKANCRIVSSGFGADRTRCDRNQNQNQKQKQ